MSIKGWMDVWMDKMRCSYTTEQYSTLKRNEVLIPATAQMTLEKVTLSKRPDTKGYTLCGCTYMKCPQQAGPQRKQTLVAGGLAGRTGECRVTAYWARGFRVEHREGLEAGSGDGCTTS